MTPIFCPDVSEFQATVNDNYNADREWFIFRLCFDGTFKPDAHVADNLAWAKRALADGRIRGFTGYVVPLDGFGSNDRTMDAVNALNFPHDQQLMIDAETWRGTSYEISGDHTSQFNDLADKFRTRQGGQADLVVKYGNAGDIAELWSGARDWLGWIVANYATKLAPDAYPNMIGQQYTNGQLKYDKAGWPSSTSPFGRCDHNILYKLPGGTLDVALTTDDITKVADASANTTLDKRFINLGASNTPVSIRDVLHQAHDLAAAAKAQTDTLETSVTALKNELDAVQAALTGISTGSVDYATLAAAVAEELEKRLAS